MLYECPRSPRWRWEVIQAVLRAAPSLRTTCSVVSSFFHLVIPEDSSESPIARVRPLFYSAHFWFANVFNSFLAGAFEQCGFEVLLST